MKHLVLSDFHMGHRSSRALRDLRSLSQFAAHFDQVVICGDALEPCDECSASRSGCACLRQLRDALTTRSAPPVFLTGNHDPDVSKRHYFYIEEAQLLAFHGDFVLRRSAPWVPQERIFEERVTQALRQLPNAPDFDEQVRLFREIRIEYLREFPLRRAKQNPLRYVFGHLFPPTGVLAVLRYWWRLPRCVAGFTSGFPHPVKHVVFGHSHRPGQWRIHGLHLYNTGSFMPFSKPHAVIVEGAQVSYASLRRLMQIRK